LPTTAFTTARCPGVRPRVDRPVSARSQLRPWTVIALALAVIGLAITLPTASAAATRAEYVAQVDPICAAAQAQERAAAQQLKRKLRKLARHPNTRKARRRAIKHELRAIARFYGYVAAVEQSVNAQVATIPPAVEDTSLITLWLRVRAEQVVATQRLASAPVKGDIFAALDMFFEASDKVDEAGDIVRDLGFQHCSARLREVAF
jgi:hypothetical protein